MKFGLKWVDDNLVSRAILKNHFRHSFALLLERKDELGTRLGLRIPASKLMNRDNRSAEQVFRKIQKTSRKRIREEVD